MSMGDGVRVLYIIDSLSRSGAEQSLASIAPHLLRRGVGLEVAYLVERPGVLGDLKSAGVKVHAVTQPGSRLARARALRDLIRIRRPDLVHTTLFESDVTGRIAARLAGVPSVTSLVNVAYGSEQRSDRAINPAKLLAARWADRLTANLAVRFHAITDHVAARMSTELQVSRDLIDVIPRGRDRATLGVASPARRVATRESLDLASSDVILFAASRHEYQKGLDILIEAMPGILARVPNAMLLIAGRHGNQTDDLRRRVRKLGIGSRVRMLGMRSDVPDLMVASDVFILPSRWEGFGGVLIEAMALGAPIVATDLTTIREVAADTALYCRPEAATSLVAAVLHVLDDGIAAAARVNAAAQRYEALYTVNRVAERMMNFYGRALEGRTSPS